jgi:hypothetical protein
LATLRLGGRNFRLRLLSSFQIICIVRSHVFQKLFTPRAQRFCGAISDPWFTRKPEDPWN